MSESNGVVLNRIEIEAPGDTSVGLFPSYAVVDMKGHEALDEAEVKEILGQIKMSFDLIFDDNCEVFTNAEVLKQVKFSDLVDGSQFLFANCWYIKDSSERGSNAVDFRISDRHLIDSDVLVEVKRKKFYEA